MTRAVQATTSPIALTLACLGVAGVVVGPAPATAEARFVPENCVACLFLNEDSRDIAVPKSAPVQATHNATQPHNVAQVQAQVPAPATLPVTPVIPATPASPSTTPPPLTPQATPPPRPRRDINPYSRDVEITVPLNFNRRVLGELSVRLTADDRFLVYSEGFSGLLRPLLTPVAQAELSAFLAGRDTVSSEDLAPSGIRLDYDPGLLSVLVLSIEPSKRAILPMFDGGRSEPREALPLPFSAYVNGNLSVQRRASDGEIRPPQVFLDGAVRLNGFVFEASGQGQEDRDTGEYGATRRYARIVYDQPEQFRRWFVGDLEVEFRGKQGFVEMGGIGVARRRDRFDSFRNSVLSGSRTIILREESTVRVMRNGLLVRELRLDAGQYDLSNLPLTLGGNDIKLDVNSISGRSETIAYSAYLDGIDLEPGDYEYAAYLGALSTGAFGSPQYDAQRLAFTAFYRKAFWNRPAIGVGLQVAQDSQVITGQTQFLLKNASRLQFDGAISNADAGTGFAASVGYDFARDLGAKSDSFNVVVNYTSGDFTNFGNNFSNVDASWAVSLGYSKRFSEDLYTTLSAQYRSSQGLRGSEAYGVNLTTTYRFNPRWSAQIGLEYQQSNASQFATRGNEAGLLFSLVWQPNFVHRSEARYSSRTNSGLLSYDKSSFNRVGSIGYGIQAAYDDGPVVITGQGSYVGARFDAGIAHTTIGADFNSLTDEQITSVRFGTSIATAGGKVALGRTISDSFALVYPHKTLGNRQTIVGDNLEGGNYNGRSGFFGPALANTLGSYYNQSIRYDVLNVPPGYDIGDGVLRVSPSYRSGYAIEVGSAAFVSAKGRLVSRDGKPVPLASGRISLIAPANGVAPSSPQAIEQAKPKPFFTNSTGRFAAQNLEPGQRYRIELFTAPPVSFELHIPTDTTGLVDLKTVILPFDLPKN